MSKSLQKHNNGQNGYDEISTFSIPKKEQGGGGLDPKVIVFTILRYKWLILLFLILGGAGGWYYANTLTPVYESTGTMLIKSPGEDNDELKNIINQTTGVGTNATLANEMQIIQSRSFARQVARNITEDEEIDVENLPVFWRELEDGSRKKRNLESVTNAIRSGLKVQLMNRDADVIQIGFQSSSPEETATIINAAMNVYVEESTVQNRQAAEQTTAFYEKERARLKKELDEAENELENFMNRTGIVRVDNQATSAVSRRENIQAELEEVQLDLQSVEQSIRNQEEELERLKPGLVNDFSDAVAPRINSLQQTLQEYERERYLILQNYPNVRQREETPPRLKFLDEQIEKLKGDITELSSEIFSEENEYMGMESSERTQMVTEIQNRLIELRMEKNQLTSRIEVLEERKEEADVEFNEMPQEMIQLAQLERDAEMKEQLYVDVSRKYADISSWKETQYGNGRIVDEAVPSNSPVSPNVPILLVMGVVLGGLISGLIITTREFFDNTISSMGEVQTSDIPLLASVPAINKKQAIRIGRKFKKTNAVIPSEMVLLHDHSSVMSESIRRLKNNIIHQNSDKIPKTIAVTSPEKGDGKSTIVCNLAVAFAEDGYKTLLVDSDFRRAKVHTYFGFSNEPGISNYLHKEFSLSKLIKHTDLKHLKVITAGANIQRPDILAGSKGFMQLLERMKDIFDVILIDTPPYGIISDSTAVLKKVDATVVVAKYRKTNQPVFVHTIEELRRINANISGFVLNDYDPQKDASGYHRAGYYKSMYEGYENYVSD